MNDDKVHSEILALLKNACDDIERAKQMGWRDFYYILFAIGAVTGLYRAVFEKLTVGWVHHLFFVAPSALMVLGIWLVWATQCTLSQRRKLVDCYYTHLDQGVQQILNGPLGTPLNRELYPRLYTAAMIIAAVFSTTVMVALKLSSQ
jgi:hypothetical protein